MRLAEGFCGAVVNQRGQLWSRGAAAPQWLLIYTNCTVGLRFPYLPSFQDKPEIYICI